jgi:putative membrane protein
LASVYKELAVDGFLPLSRASFVLDFIALAMAAVIPVMLVSLYQVRQRKNYDVHRRLQVVLGIVLGLAILVFELDMRLNGWRQYAEPSPYYKTLVIPSLIFHLGFAIPTLFLWIFTLTMALKHRIHVTSGKYRSQHKIFGWLSALAMIGTTLSGWLFFWLAFMA